MTLITEGVHVQYRRCHNRRVGQGVVRRIDGDVLTIVDDHDRKFRSIGRDAVRKVFGPGSKGGAR
jgi:hypothetical protein